MAKYYYLVPENLERIHNLQHKEWIKRLLPLDSYEAPAMQVSNDFH
jgi:hypothetical protein